MTSNILWNKFIYSYKIISIVACLIFLYSVSVQPLYADGWSLVGSANATGTVSVALPITDVQVSGGSTTTVPVKLRVTSGSLQMATTTGLTFNGSQTGSTIYFSGTRDAVNTALASLTYTRGSTGTDTLEVSLVDYGEVFFSDNGHLYEYVSYTSNWNTAKTQAEARTKYGATGYLATIGSQAENDFVSARLLNAGWMGASDSVSEGVWRWVTGPENGTQFWSGTSGGNTVGGNYANWGTGEPNDSSGEDCAQFLAGGSGKWNDLPCSTYNLPGYVVEYGAPGNLPTVTAKNVSIVTVSTPTVSSFSPTDGSTDVAVDSDLIITFSQPMYASTGTLAIWETNGPYVFLPMSASDTSIISGLGTNIITINPTNDFSENTDYYVTIDSNAFRNASNSHYTGTGATTTWNFRIGDFTSPIMSSITATSTSSTTATITWATDELSSSFVSYDPDPSLIRFTTPEADTSPRVLSHSVSLTDLAPCTWYRYRVHSADAAGNTATSSYRSLYTTGCKGSSPILNLGSTSITPTSESVTSVGDYQTVTVTTPAYFLDASSTVALQIAALSSASVESAISKPTGYSTVGTNFFDIKILSNTSDLVETTDAPVTITYSYTEFDIANLDESTLKIFHYHNNEWQQLNSCVVDAVGNTVTCTTNSFSVFGLFGTARVVSVSTVTMGPSGLSKVYGCRDSRAKNYSTVVAHKQEVCVYTTSQQNVERDVSVDTISRTSTSTQALASVPYSSNTNLYLGVRHPDVVGLQKFLNDKGFIITTSGPGSKGNETDMFGQMTRQALIRFQRASGISPAIGFYGPITRQVVEKLK